MNVSRTKYATKEDLDNMAVSLTARLTDQLTDMITTKLTEMTWTITELFRDELDSKLAAQESRLMLHTEEVVGRHSVELLQSIANIVEPHGKRITRLERKVFGT